MSHREHRDHYSGRDRESSSRKDYEKVNKKEKSEKKSLHKDKHRSDKKKSHHKERDRSYERKSYRRHRDSDRSRSEKKKSYCKERERSEDRKSQKDREKFSKLVEKRKDNHEESDQKKSSILSPSSSSASSIASTSLIRSNKQKPHIEINLSPQTPSSLVASASAKANVVDSTTTVQLPSYYNPNLVDANKFAEQQKKRKLIWSNKESDSKNWSNLKFSQDEDGSKANKFMRLMGIKDPKESSKTDETNSDSLLKNMEREYEVARTFTHIERGRGFGFNVEK